MTYTPPEGVTIGSFTADTLPASFRAPADAVISYKIYGTEAGVGEETDNLFNISDYTIGDTTFSTKKLTLEPDTAYTMSSNAPLYNNGALFVLIAIGESGTTENNGVYNGHPITKSTDANGNIYVGLRDNNSGYDLATYQTMLVKGTTVPISYTPPGYEITLTAGHEDQTDELIVYIGDSQLSTTEYVDSESGKIYKLQEGELTPTDPPLPLPTITTYDGENTISSTETLGDVEFTGEWAAIMGSTEDESIDIEFSVDAEEYIAFVTVDDEPSIQVSDTITMPASASSFTLQVVSWGREQYTDTVYNALS